MLQETTILDLQKILLEEFSCEYSKEQVAEIAGSLVSYVETLLEIKNNKHDTKSFEQPRDARLIS
jgi:hypothetical protein